MDVCKIKKEEIKHALNQYNEALEKKYSREHSWEFCYVNFYKAFEKEQLDENEIDYLALHLSNYLASWGMFRNSFLLEVDYKVHIPVVKILLKYRKSNKQPDFENVYSEIEEYYKSLKQDIEWKNNTVTDTLISKILLGTMGIIPAFDENVKAVIKEVDAGIVKSLNAGNIKSNCDKLEEFYRDRISELIKEPIKIRDTDIEYTRMKILDAILWEIGAKRLKENSK